jgi:REP element-mobilizing transposase RayT
MENHYHLLIETPDGNLSLGMRHLNGVYTQLCNKRHQRTGHLFQEDTSLFSSRKTAIFLKSVDTSY